MRSAIVTLAFAALAACGSSSPPPRLTLAEGFTVEVAAGPPLVERPMIVDFDEQGRLYVAESSGSNAPVREQLENPTHSILRLEDADGDGVYDRRTVFADRVMFPEGVLYHAGSVYVAAPPHIWKLTDDDGDGVADRREIWHDGQTLTNCANDLHGPYLGRDGWIYWTKGAFAEQTHATTAGGTLVTKAAHVFRRRPEGGPLESVLTGGMDNPVEVAFSPEGERFLTSTFLEQPSAGRRDGLIHMLYGGVYGKIHGVIDSHPQTGGLQPAMTHMGPAAPVGLAYYESAVFGPEYRGNLFVTQFNTRRVSRHRLVPDGASFRTEDSDFLVSEDFDFHPTDVAEDADGSLLVVDTGGWYKLCCPTSQIAKPDVPGAIYRVRRKGAAKVADPRGLALEWAEASPEALAGRLGDERPFVARRAVAELGARGAAAVQALAAVLGDASGSLDARRDAVWALARIDDPAARAAVRRALGDAEASVRHAAAHVAGLWRDAEAVDKLTAVLAAGAPPLRRAAAEALGRIGDSRATRPLLTAAGAEGDSALVHSATYALIELGDERAIRAALGEASPASRRAGLIALDQAPGGSRLRSDEIVPLLSSPEPLLRETAAWIAVRHPEWGGHLAGFFLRALASPGNETRRATLEAQLAAFSAHPAIRDLLAAAASGAAKPARLVALGAMAARPPKPAPAGWLGALDRALRSPDADVARAALAAARALDKEDAPKLTPALAALGRSASAPDELRTAAFALAAPSLDELDDASFAYLLGRLAPERPVAERGAAARALASARLRPKQRLAVAEAIETAGPMEAPTLLDAFASGGDEALGLRLAETIERARAASSLSPGAVAAVFEKFPPSVRERGRAALAALDAAHASREAKLAELAEALPAGDVRRGQAVFNSEKAACMACHRVGYIGGRVGPDLTRIGEIRTERDLLEAVVFPSASFVRGYEPLVVETAEDLYNGVVVEETDAGLLLATGADTRARIERSAIEDARPGTVSIMPSGLDTELSRQELADLIAFLKNARWGPN